MPRDERDEDAAAGYWSVLKPWWERIDIYSGPEAFLASYAAAPLVERDLFEAARYREYRLARERRQQTGRERRLANREMRVFS